MKQISSQVSSLMEEVDRRESTESKLSELQLKFQALLIDRKQSDSNYKARIDDFKSKIQSLENEKGQLQEKLHRARQEKPSEQGSRSLDANSTNLQSKYQRSEKFSAQRAADLKTEVQKARNLNTKLVAAEASSNELQKKYDESKRNYMRIREERERLKGELE